MFQIVLCHQIIISSWGYVNETFNSIQDKWYLGNIILPSTVILLKCMKAITFEIVWLSRLDGAPCRKFTWDTGTPILPGPHILGYKFQRLMISQFKLSFPKPVSGACTIPSWALSYSRVVQTWCSPLSIPRFVNIKLNPCQKICPM